MSSEQGAVANATGGVEMGLIQRIIGIFTSPGQAFESIRTKPNWLVPTILMVHPTNAYLVSWRAKIFNLKNSISRKP